jgi:hypothetical protein
MLTAPDVDRMLDVHVGSTFALTQPCRVDA